MKFGYLRSDDDGHWYLIPEADVEKFDALMRESYDVGTDTDRWYEICDEISAFPMCDSPEGVKCVIEE